MMIGMYLTIEEYSDIQVRTQCMYPINQVYRIPDGPIQLSSAGTGVQLELEVSSCIQVGSARRPGPASGRNARLGDHDRRDTE